MTREAPLRVGVTGHRSLGHVEAVAAAVDLALTRVMEVHPDRRLVVVSSLAEGADRIVVRRALERDGAALVAVLPFRPDDYATDFVSAESRKEFAGLLQRASEVIVKEAAGSREACYEAAGHTVLDQSDVLIAVWDGGPPQGRGGTAEIVSEARARGLPLAWVRARRPDDLSPVSDRGNIVNFERL